MIKILYVLNAAFAKGGTESVVLNYYKYVNGGNIKIDFAVNATQDEYNNNEIIKKLISQGTKVYRITPRYKSLYRNHKDLKAAFSNEYDIIHTHTDAIGADILRVAKSSCKSIKIAHSHSTNFPIKPDTLKNKIKYQYLKRCRLDIRNEADYYMACSNEAAEWLFGKENVKNTYILNDAIDIEKYAFSSNKRVEIRNSLGFKNTDIVLGNVGRFTIEKNHIFLLEIFREIHKQNHNTKLLLIGDGELREKLIDFVDDSQLTKDVIFYGITDKVGDLLNAMDIFVFPSLWEGFGLALIEAQANGLPCLVTDSPKVTHSSDLTGQITWIPIEKKDEWINKALNCNLKRNIMSQTLIAEKGFDLKAEAKKLSSFYASILKSNSPSDAC